MRPGRHPLAELLGRHYARRGPDVPFDALLRQTPARDEDALAELIETDGRARIALGKPVTLRRYLDAVPDLESMPVALDAAIDVALRHLSGSAKPTPDAVQVLILAHPDLEPQIRDAAVLAEGMWTTTGLRRHLDSAGGRSLPEDFGPPVPSGDLRYELRELLGAGGWGEVYLAVDRQMSEEGHLAFVAIKLLRGRDRDPFARQRLSEEATKARRIDHPNVARVLDRGVSAQDEDYIVYEYVAAGDLADWLDRLPAPPSPAEAARLAARIANGVQAAHSAGLVHCDLKPGNILMTPDGEPKVADFGISVRAGDASGGAASPDRPVGNFAFISPEQFRMEEGSLTIPSDIYALGGILYYLLTRRCPNGDSIEEIRRNHDRHNGRADPPDPRDHVPNIDRDLAAICARAMAPRPEDRYTSAGAFAADLEAWCRREPIPWTRPSAARVIRLWAARRPAVAAAAALIAATAAASAVVVRHYSELAALERREADAAAARIDTARTTLENMYVAVRAANRKGIGDQMLPLVMMLEWTCGPAIIGTSGSGSLLWHERVRIVREQLAEAERTGHAGDLEPLVLESALGFWLTCDGNFAEAEPLLARNIERWRERLAPDDLWIRRMEAVAACAAAARTLDADPQRALTRAELLALAEPLNRAAEQCFTGSAAGSPVHRLVLRTLVRLYEPGRIGDAAAHRRLTAILKAAGD